MTELFDRRAKLTLVPRQAGDKVSIEIPMRIAFAVEKTIKSDSNKAIFDVYNLAQRTRDRLHERGDVVRFEAGYAGLTELLYEGEVTRASSRRDGADYVTTIQCGDGDATFATQTVQQEFEAGTRVRDVIKLVAGAFTRAAPNREDESIKFGPQPKVKQQEKEVPPRIAFRDIERDLNALDADLSRQGFALNLRRGMSVSGNAAEVMDKLARMWRFDWSVQDGVFQLASYGRAVVGEAVLLTPATGLIGIPARTEHGALAASLLIPQLRPGIQVNVESENLTGMFRAETVRFTGDTRADDWTAEVDMRDLATL